MPFKRILRELSERVGADGAIMLDWEGEAVDSFSNSEKLELDAIGAHKGIILNMIQQVSMKSSAAEDVQSIGISTNDYKIAIAVIKDGYYILLVMSKNKPLGKAFFEARKSAKELLKEMG
ncbi:MAG: hypothetical protein KAR06_11345 [Deltaproteobacteria bacterium]|nr:hypothetical protein [Deltaproteobacteria bacterium]